MMWNRNRGGNATSGGGGRPLPHVISGQAGYKEGGSGVQADSSGRDEKLTLGNWVASAVDERDDQRKRLVAFEALREMFEGHLDTEVVQTVLSACDWQEDKAVEKLLELTTDSQASFSGGCDNIHTLDGIARWLGGGKGQRGIPEWGVTGTRDLLASDRAVCAKGRTNSTASFNSSKISYSEAARKFADRRSAENLSVTELRNFNSTDIPQQNSSSRQSASVCRQLFQNSGHAMANNKASSQGLDDSRGSLEQGWSIDKDEVYLSDEEGEEEGEEACGKIPTELECRNAPIDTSPFQYSHSNLVDNNLRTLNPWASVFSPFNISAVPFNASSSSVDGNFSGSKKSGDQPNSYLDDFIMPRLPVQMSSQYSPNESRIFTPPKANAVQKQEVWPSGAGQNTVSPHPVRNAVSPHPVRNAVSLHPVRNAVSPHPVRNAVSPHPVQYTVLPHPIWNTVSPHAVRNAVSPHPVRNAASPHPVQNAASPHAVYRFPVVNSARALNVEEKKTAASEPNANVTVLSATAAKSKVLQMLQGHKVMVLLRGCPGSGKSTLAKQIKYNGLILSADSYFERNGKYEYDASKIGDAHGWCKHQALRAMKNGINPVIIDNTNTQAWEMLPYVEMAIDCSYQVEVIEPDVPWRLKAKELAKFNSHGVPANKLQSMLSRYQSNITGQSLLNDVVKKRQMAYKSSTLSPDVQKTLSAQVRGNENNEDGAKPELEKVDRKRRNRRKKKLTVKDDDPSAKENEKDELEDNNNENNHEADKSCDASQFHDAKHDLIAFDDMQRNSESTNGNVMQCPRDLCNIETCRTPDFQDRITEKEPAIKATTGFNLRNEKALIMEKLRAANLDSRDGGNFAACLLSCPTNDAASENDAPIAGGAGVAGLAANDDERLLPVSDFLGNDSSPDVEILDELEVEIEDLNGEPSQLDASVESFRQSSDAEQAVDRSTESVLSEISCLNLQKKSETPLPASSTCLSESLPCIWDHMPTETKNYTELSYWSNSESQNDSYTIGGKLDGKSLTILDGDHAWPECDASEKQTDGSISCLDGKLTPMGIERRSEPLQQDMMSDALEKESVETWLTDSKWEIPSLGQSPSYSKKCSTPPQKAVTIDTPTQTEAKDLTAAYRLENDPSYWDETFYRTLSARPRVIFDRESSILSQQLLDTKISLISKLDESTMTDDSLDGDVDSKIEFLSECFPTVLRDDLQYLLSSCGNDADIAVNTLLDFGYEYNEPRHREPDLSVEILAAVVVDGDESERCAAAAEQVNERVRFSKHPVSYKLYQDSIKPNLLSAEFELHRHRDFRTRKAGKDRPLKGQRVGVYEQNLSESKLVLSLTPTFAAQLVELFGPVGCSKPSGLMSEDDLSINISVELAQQIHAAWAASHNLCCDERNTSLDWSAGLTENPSKQALKMPAKPVSRSQYSGEINDFPRFFPRQQSPAPVLLDPEANSLSTKIKRQQLKNRYPTINSTIIDEIFEATGYSYDVTVKTIAASPELITPPKVVMTKRKAEEMELELIERAIAESLKDQYTNKLSDNNGRFINCGEVYEGLMDEAATCFKRYQECLQQAQKAHCKKMHPVAMHYSEEATRWKEKLQETKLVAAEMIMQTRLSDLSNLSSIDLHGLSVQEALHLLETSLSQRETDLLETRSRHRDCLYMITGRGSHSHGGVARIKPAVEAYLKRNNYSYTESTPGVLKVRLHIGF